MTSEDGNSFPLLAGEASARIDVCAIKVERAVGVEAVVGAALVGVVSDSESFAALAVLVVAAVGDALGVTIVLPPDKGAVTWAIGAGNSGDSVGVVGELEGVMGALVDGKPGDFKGALVVGGPGGVVGAIVVGELGGVVGAIAVGKLGGVMVALAVGKLGGVMVALGVGELDGVMGAVAVGELDGVMAAVVIGGLDGVMGALGVGELDGVVGAVAVGELDGVMGALAVGELDGVVGALDVGGLDGVVVALVVGKLGGVKAAVAVGKLGGVMRALVEGLEDVLAGVFVGKPGDVVAVTIVFPSDGGAVAGVIGAEISDGAVGLPGDLVGAATVAVLTGLPVFFAGGVFKARIEAWIISVERLEAGASVVAGVFAGVVVAGMAAVAIGIFATSAVGISARESSASNIGASTSNGIDEGIDFGVGALSDGLGGLSCCCITSPKLVEDSPSDGAFARVPFEGRAAGGRTPADG